MNKCLAVLWVALLAITANLTAGQTKIENKNTIGKTRKLTQVPTSGDRVNKDPLGPWVDRTCQGTFIYKFNVFNLAPESVNQNTLRAILLANIKDIHRNYRKDWGVELNIRLYPGDQISNPLLFKGDRIPFFVVPSFNLTEGRGFHSNDASEPANSQSVLWGGMSIFDTLSLVVPNNFPSFTPYGAVSIAAIQEGVEQNIANNNPFGITDFKQLLSWTISHELKETLSDDSSQNAVPFDNFAPTVATWHFAEFDANGVCTNGTLGPDGFVHLPLFLDVFPAGGVFTTFQESCDAVSTTVSSKLQSYQVNGWSMSNYLTPNFWRGYYLSDSLKWDKLGLVETPLQPFAGLHEEVVFLDFDSGLSSFIEVVNWGPVTASQRGEPAANNFPPDYTYAAFLGAGPGSAKNQKSLGALKRSLLKPKPKN